MREMTMTHASIIAELINEQNQVVIRYSAHRVYTARANYIWHIDGEGQLVGCAELKRVQWYQFEISHVSVDALSTRKGIGRSLVMRAEEHAKQNGGRILQCTIRRGNLASEAMFLDLGFENSAVFYYPMTGNSVGVWVKAISREPDVD